MKLSVPVPFKIPSRKVHFTIIGCGGNGSHLVHDFTRLMKVHNERGLGEYLLTVADADIVEEKNIARQNFFFSDKGKNKAEVLANRYSRSHGLEIGVIKDFIESETDLIKMMEVPGYFPVVISCVDNHKSRKVVNSVFTKYPERFIWIDSGNSEFTGQVNLGFNTHKRLNEDDSQGHMFKMPSVMEVFPEILEKEDKFKSEESCDDMGVQNNDQNIATNVLVATQIFAMLNQLLGENGLSTYMVKFNSKTGETVPFKTTYKNLKNF